MAKIRVGILGATGAVGQRFLQLLDRHPQFVVTALAASDRSQGRPYAEGVHLAAPGRLCRPPPPPSSSRLPSRPSRATWCSRACRPTSRTDRDAVRPGRVPGDQQLVVHRMDDGVPLLVPEVNPDHLVLLKARSGRGSS